MRRLFRHDRRPGLLLRQRRQFMERHRPRFAGGLFGRSANIEMKPRMDTNKHSAACAATTGARLSQPQHARMPKNVPIEKPAPLRHREGCGWDSRAPNSLLKLRELSSLYDGFPDKWAASLRPSNNPASQSSINPFLIRFHLCPSVVEQ